MLCTIYCPAAPAGRKTNETYCSINCSPGLPASRIPTITLTTICNDINCLLSHLWIPIFPPSNSFTYFSQNFVVLLNVQESGINFRDFSSKKPRNMGGSSGDVGEVLVTWVKQRKGCKINCDVGEATEGLENEL